jgi:hypothetical protein
VDNQVSDKSKWFAAAAVVTSWNAVGAADNVNLWFLSDAAEKFLQAGNKYLFSFNMDNAKNLMAETLNKSFTAANGEKISMQGLKDKAMDYVMGSKFAPDAIRKVMNEKFDGANPLILTAMKTGLN